MGRSGTVSGHQLVALFVALALGKMVVKLRGSLGLGLLGNGPALGPLVVAGGEEIVKTVDAAGKVFIPVAETQAHGAAVAADPFPVKGRSPALGDVCQQVHDAASFTLPETGSPAPAPSSVHIRAMG